MLLPENRSVSSSREQPLLSHYQGVQNRLDIFFCSIVVTVRPEPVEGQAQQERLGIHRNLRNPLLKSLPAVGRCEIKRAFSSFSELSKKRLDREMIIY